MTGTRPLVAVALLALAAGLVVLLGYTGRDDSHITYFAADQLARGHGLVNTFGEHQEQSSSLLFTLLLALLGVVTHLPAVTLGPVVSAAAMLGSAILVARLAQRCCGDWLAGVVACFTPALFYWSLSGMEVSLYVLLLIWLLSLIDDAVDATRPSALTWVMAVAVCVALTRPEAPIVLACVAAWFAVARPLGARRVAGALLAASGGAFALRLAVGLDLFPAPVYAKQQLGLRERLDGGLDYLVSTAWQLPASTLVSLAALVVCLAAWRASGGGRQGRVARMCVMLAVSVGAFAWLSGGDWMEAGRFLAPTYVFVALGAQCVAPPRVRPALGTALVLASCVDLAMLARQPFGGVPLYAAARELPQHYRPGPFERYSLIHGRDLPFVDAMLPVLARDPRRPIVVASVQGGMVPYYVSRAVGDRVRFVDLVGLTSRRTQACIGPPSVDPYADLHAVATCLGTRFDYVFDLDTDAWPRLERLVAQGCVELVRDARTMHDVAWKAPVAVRQFLVRCEGE